MRFPILVYFGFCSLMNVALHSQSQITKTDACKRYNAAVVQILMPMMEAQVNGRKVPYSANGSGFIVSPSGLVVTAGHVIIDPFTNQYYPTITAIVEQSRGDPHWITMVPITTLEDAKANDVAVLQMKDDPAIGKLPFLEIAYDPNARDQPGTSLGSDIVLIGQPSAVGLAQKFCLFGTVAAPARPDFYYQAPTVKGMSGGPIISLDSGKVVGLIDKLVNDLEARMNSSLGMGVGSPYIHLALGKGKENNAANH